MRRRNKNAQITAENPELYTTNEQGAVIDGGQAEVITTPTENVGTQEEPTQTNASVQGNETPTADDIIKGTWQKPNVPQGDIPDESKLTIVEDIKNNKELKSTTTPSKPQAIYNMYMDSVIERAKGMEGGLTSENIQKAQQELSVPRLKQSSLDTNITFEEKKEEQPKTSETPQATQEEEDKKPYGDDWLYEFSKINPKPNVLSDLGFHGFEKYEVPDDLLNYWGKDLKGAIDDIKDENGNPLTDEQKKRILRRIRGVRAGNALMQIANIAGQTAAISQGGAPVKMDNSTILGNIHKNAQAKKDAWLKQALKAKETANKDKMDMLNYQLDLQKALWGKEDKDLTREIQKQKAILDWQKENRLISEFEYRMKKDALTLEEQKRHNQATENISQQNANTRKANSTVLKDYKLFTVGNSYQSINRHQIKSATGALVDELIKNAKAKNDKKYTSDGAKQYWNGKDIEQIKKDAKSSEQFIQEVLSSYPEMASVIAPYFADAETTIAVASTLGNPYEYNYGGDYSSIDNEITDDYLD